MKEQNCNVSNMFKRQYGSMLNENHEKLYSFIKQTLAILIVITNLNILSRGTSPYKIVLLISVSVNLFTRSLPITQPLVIHVGGS